MKEHLKNDPVLQRLGTVVEGGDIGESRRQTLALELGIDIEEFDKKRKIVEDLVRSGGDLSSFEDTRMLALYLPGVDDIEGHQLAKVKEFHVEAFLQMAQEANSLRGFAEAKVIEALGDVFVDSDTLLSIHNQHVPALERCLSHIANQEAARARKELSPKQMEKRLGRAVASVHLSIVQEGRDNPLSIFCSPDNPQKIVRDRELEWLDFLIFREVDGCFRLAGRLTKSDFEPGLRRWCNARKDCPEALEALYNAFKSVNETIPESLKPFLLKDKENSGSDESLESFFGFEFDREKQRVEYITPGLTFWNSEKRQSFVEELLSFDFDQNAHEESQRFAEFMKNNMSAFMSLDSSLGYIGFTPQDQRIVEDINNQMKAFSAALGSFAGRLNLETFRDLPNLLMSVDLHSKQLQHLNRVVVEAEGLSPSSLLRLGYKMPSGVARKLEPKAIAFFQAALAHLVLVPTVYSPQLFNDLAAYREVWKIFLKAYGEDIAGRPDLQKILLDGFRTAKDESDEVVIAGLPSWFSIHFPTLDRAVGTTKKRVKKVTTKKGRGESVKKRVEWNCEFIPCDNGYRFARWDELPTGVGSDSFELISGSSVWEILIDEEGVFELPHDLNLDPWEEAALEIRGKRGERLPQGVVLSSYTCKQPAEAVVWCQNNTPKVMLDEALFKLIKQEGEDVVLTLSDIVEEWPELDGVRLWFRGKSYGLEDQICFTPQDFDDRQNKLSFAFGDNVESKGASKEVTIYVNPKQYSVGADIKSSPFDIEEVTVLDENDVDESLEEVLDAEEALMAYLIDLAEKDLEGVVQKVSVQNDTISFRLNPSVYKEYGLDDLGDLFFSRQGKEIELLAAKGNVYLQDLEISLCWVAELVESKYFEDLASRDIQSSKEHNLRVERILSRLQVDLSTKEFHSHRAGDFKNSKGYWNWHRFAVAPRFSDHRKELDERLEKESIRLDYNYVKGEGLMALKLIREGCAVEVGRRESEREFQASGDKDDKWYALLVNVGESLLCEMALATTDKIILEKVSKLTESFSERELKQFLIWQINDGSARASNGDGEKPDEDCDLEYFWETGKDVLAKRSLLRFGLGSESKGESLKFSADSYDKAEEAIKGHESIKKYVIRRIIQTLRVEFDYQGEQEDKSREKAIFKNPQIRSMLRRFAPLVFPGDELGLLLGGAYRPTDLMEMKVPYGDFEIDLIEVFIDRLRRKQIGLKFEPEVTYPIEDLEAFAHRNELELHKPDTPKQDGLSFSEEIA